MSTENVVKEPAASPTASAIPTPLPSASPASAASPVGGVKPDATGAPATGAVAPTPEVKPAEPKVVPIEALHEERSKRQALDNQLAQLKAVLGDKFAYDANGNVVQINAPAAQPQQNQFAEEVEKAWVDDPKKAVRMEQMAALNWIDATYQKLEEQKDVLATKVSDFGQFERAVNKQLRSMTLEQRAQPGAVEYAYTLVKGRTPSNLEEQKKVWEAEYRAKQAAADAAQGIPGGTFSVPPSNGIKAPTNDQLKAAAAMGIKIEEYMGHVK